MTNRWKMLAAVEDVGGGPTVPDGLSDSLLTISGTNDAWTTRTVDISAYANKQVYLVFRYQNGAGFTGDIQLDNIQLDGTTYSFENVTHSFETSDADNSSTYTGVTWTPVAVQENSDGRWQVDSGGTPSNGTGRTDADDGTWYIYAETSAPANVSGYNIWLRSPPVTLSASPTLQFAEARNGADIGTLDVHLDVIPSQTFGNPEDDFGIPDYTITTFPSTGAGVASSEDAIVAVDFTPTTAASGILFDLGGNGGAGFAAGVNNGTLRVRAFNTSGDSAWTDPASAYVEVDLTSYLNSPHTFYFIVDQSTTTLSVMVKEGLSTSGNPVVLLGENTSDGTNTQVYGGNGKGYAQDNTSADLTINFEGNYTSPSDITEIRIWAEDATLDSSTFGDNYGLGGGGTFSPVLVSSQNKDLSAQNSPDAYTVDCSSVVSTDLVVVLYQADSILSVSSATAAGTTMTQDGVIEISRYYSSIYSVAGSAVAGNSTASFSFATNESGDSSAIQVFRIPNASTITATQSEAATVDLNATDVTISDVINFSSGVLFASAIAESGGTSATTFDAGIETDYEGITASNVNLLGASRGGFNTTPTTAAHTVTFTCTNSFNDIAALVTVVYDGAGGGGNNPPTAVNDTFSTNYETALSDNVLTNDTDPDNDTLTVTNNTNPSNGSVTVNTNGSFTYTPNNGFSGNDSFTYTVSDGNGGTDTGTVTITVGAPPSDFTPDPVNWTDIQEPEGSANGTTNTQTITGISTAISLEVTFTQGDDQYSLSAFVNGSSAAGPTNSPGTLNFTVNNNDTVYFRVDVPDGNRAQLSNVTIVNTSDGNATLDTFTIIEVDNR